MATFLIIFIMWYLLPFILAFSQPSPFVETSFACLLDTKRRYLGDRDQQPYYDLFQITECKIGILALIVDNSVDSQLRRAVITVLSMSTSLVLINIRWSNVILQEEWNLESLSIGINYLNGSEAAAHLVLMILGSTGLDAVVLTKQNVMQVLKRGSLSLFTKFTKFFKPLKIPEHTNDKRSN